MTDPEALLAQAAEAIRRVEEYAGRDDLDGLLDWVAQGAHCTGTLPLMRTMYATAVGLEDRREPFLVDTRSGLCSTIIRAANEIVGDES